MTEPNRVFALSLYPLIGITLTALVTKYLLNGNLGRGIGPIIYSTARENARVPRSKLYSQLITAFLTVPFGGSAGTEAPISVTGAALGSNAGAGAAGGPAAAAAAHRVRGGGGHGGHLQRAHRGGAVRGRDHFAGAAGAVFYSAAHLVGHGHGGVEVRCTRASRSRSSPTRWVAEHGAVLPAAGPAHGVVVGVHDSDLPLVRSLLGRAGRGCDWRKVLLGGTALGGLDFPVSAALRRGLQRGGNCCWPATPSSLTDGSLFSGVRSDNNVWLLLVLVLFHAC
ncbi:MAG: hypothetical protein WKG07_41170 [Hymenobacter sp.]